MIPLQYKPQSASTGETVAYVVFDMEKWRTKDDLWQTGLPEEATAGEKPKEQAPEIPSTTTGGSGTFRVIGMDGEIGNGNELIMATEKDRKILSLTIASSIWKYYLARLMGTDSSGQIKMRREISNNRTLEYVPDSKIISIMDNAGGYELATLDVSPSTLKISKGRFDVLTKSYLVEEKNFHEIMNDFGI